MTSAVPKLFALVFSLMLGSGYVWFRAGGSIPYIAPAKQAAANPDRSVLPGSKSGFGETVEFRETLREASDVVVSPEVLERTLIGGSKSDQVEFTSLPAVQNLFVEPAPDPVTKYSQYRATTDRETADARMLMPSTKMGVVYFGYGPQVEPKSEPKPKPQPQPVVENPKPRTPDANDAQQSRTLMSGSKSEAVRFHRPDAQTAPAAQQRTILPGSKSMKISAPPPVPTAPEEKQPRAFLPGSKSFAVTPTGTIYRPNLQPYEKPKATPDEEDHFETVIVNEVETTGPDGKKTRTLLPGSKSAFQPLDPTPTKTAAPADSNRQSSIVNRQSAQPAPVQTQQQVEQIRKRTLLPGSKSSGFSTDRED